MSLTSRREAGRCQCNFEPASQGAGDVPANARPGRDVCRRCNSRLRVKRRCNHRRGKGDTTQDIAFNIGAPQQNTA